VPVSQTRRQALLAEVFGALEPPLRAGCATWLEGSPRLAELVEQHRDKIRKKLRVAQDAEGRRDVLAELHVARRLLVDRRCTLRYEPLLAGGGRGPDFLVAFRVNTRFAVEVARLRPGAADSVASRIVGVTSAKLAQCQPAVANVIALVADGVPAEAALEEAGRRLLALAGGAEPEYVTRRGFRDPAEFRRQFQRLSAVWLLGGLFDEAGEAAPLWPNPRARHSLPGPVISLLTR
jgi:hypothetical protein